MTTEDDSKPRRPRGRPRVPEAHSTVSVWVTVRLHDALIQRAKADERSVSATVRDLLTKARLDP